MPHTVYGLFKGIRSHQISNPSVQETLETGGPNACNLCHLDKTLEWTATNLEKWYDIPAPGLDKEDRAISMAVAHILSGDAGQRVLSSWHTGWEPAQEASGNDWSAPYLAQLLSDPYSANRYVAARSLRSLAGFEEFTFNYMADPAL